MRIIAGIAGGTPLLAPKTNMRPTSDRVREALFSILAQHLAEARVLDLFAGSGALGIEALSRGAAAATFVEQRRGACEAIRSNLEKAKLSGGIVVQSEVRRFLQRDGGGEFDLIFADPPYANNPEAENLATALLENPRLPNFLGAGGILVLEVSSSARMPASTRWTVFDERRYGATALQFLRKSPPTA